MVLISKNDEGGGEFVPVGFNSPVKHWPHLHGVHKLEISGRWVGILGILFMKLFTISNPSFSGSWSMLV